MKRVDNIFEKIVSVENLQKADEMARKGKKSTYGVKVHDRNRESNILRLHELLRTGQYRTSDYKIFKIHEPKEREIYCLPYYPDRIVHWAIMLQLESIWMNVFTTDSFACIKGRGIHGAARRVVMALKEDQPGTHYCLKLDIKKFYPNVDQNILMSIIRRKIKCERTLQLLDEIIHSTSSGLPIGNYISQYAANLYLTYFDHWLKENLQVKYYFRYCDDIVILSSSKEYLWSMLEEIRAYLDKNLKLEVKGNYQVFPVEMRGIDFVGYRFFQSHVLLRKSIKKSMMRKCALLKKVQVDGKAYKMQMASFIGWVKQDFCSGRKLTKLIMR
jgi:retron-type reverse transcriptase